MTTTTDSGDNNKTTQRNYSIVEGALLGATMFVNTSVIIPFIDTNQISVGKLMTGLPVWIIGGFVFAKLTRLLEPSTNYSAPQRANRFTRFKAFCLQSISVGAVMYVLSCVLFPFLWTGQFSNEKMSIGIPAWIVGGAMNGLLQTYLRDALYSRFVQGNTPDASTAR